MNLQLSQPVTALSIITSCGCNLNCEYCEIAKSVNGNSVALQKATVEALQNGDFIKNIKDVLYKINQSPYQIQSMAFWGQEPTLTLHHITNHIQEWRDAFPNWKSLMFSTNSVAHMDRIVDFLVAVDNSSDKEFNISIQLSYDGDYSTDNLRGASSSTIHDNLVHLFTTLNTINFKWVNVRFNHHAVLSLHLLKQLQTTEAIAAYSRHLQLWGLEFYNLNHNRKVTLAPAVDIGLESPVQASTEDGLRLNQFCELLSRLDKQHYYGDIYKDGIIPNDPYAEVLTSSVAAFENISSAFRGQGEKTLLDTLHRCAKDPIFKAKFFRLVNPILYCGNGVGELKIMYDGTLVNCQNHIYETDINYLPKDNHDMKTNVKRALASHKYFVNPLKDSDKDIQKYFYFFETCKFESFEFIYKTTMTTMQYLAATNQIDSSYRNHEKLAVHSFIIAVMNCCSYNNQMMTGSVFLRHSGFMRFLCNGYLDKALRRFNQTGTGGL